MPQVFRIGVYVIYFWSNEGIPNEPIHVHVAKGHPIKNGTKIWISKDGKCSVEHNKSKIPNFQLNYIIRLIEARIDEIKEMWIERFGDIDYKM